jgi:hypothetical protein
MRRGQYMKCWDRESRTPEVARSPPSGALGKTKEFQTRSFDHLLQVQDELLVEPIVGGAERVQGRRAGGVKNPEQAHLLKSGLVDSGVFRLAGA